MSSGVSLNFAYGAITYGRTTPAFSEGAGATQSQQPASARPDRNRDPASNASELASFSSPAQGGRLSGSMAQQYSAVQSVTPRVATLFSATA